MSPKRIHSSLQVWKRELPTVQPYYAVKCNPDPRLLRELFSAGVHFDCASERELLEVDELGLAESEGGGGLSRRVVYANPCKSARDLAVARRLGAPLTVVDSGEEVEKLGHSAYSGGALLRIAVDDTKSVMPFSTKFGCPLKEVESIAKAARRVDISLCGVSFHVGSGCADGAAYRAAIGAAYNTILNLRAFGHTKARILDLGGGYKADEVDFAKKAEHIRWAQSEVNRAEGGLEWIAEPGRFFATGAFDLFVQVIGKKAVGGDQGFKYTIDDSLYGQFSGILFDYAQPQWVRVRRQGEQIRAKGPGVLFGRTCDSVDVIARAEAMEELEVGDWLWFPNMGAYSRATASEFNGFPTPPVLVANDLPAAATTIKENSAAFTSGIKYMTPVSARSFWSV